MARRWISSVKEKGELRVFNKKVYGQWTPVVKAALDSFNKLNTKYGLGVKLVNAKNEDQSEIVIQVAESVATYTFDEKEEVRNFDGKSFHGKTLIFGTDSEIKKAAVFLPSDPQTQAGFIRGKMVYEKANQNMMRVVAVHEFIHACCLDDNNDHAKDGVFVDRLTPVGGKLVPFWSAGRGTPMPPMFLAPETISDIQYYWN